MKTGRVATGVTTPIDLRAASPRRNRKTQLDVKLKGELTFDPQASSTDSTDLDSTQRQLGGISGMTATAKGTSRRGLRPANTSRRGFQLAVSGKQAGGDMKVKVDAPKLTLTQDKVEGGKIVLDAARSEAEEQARAESTVAACKAPSTRSGPGRSTPTSKCRATGARRKHRSRERSPAISRRGASSCRTRAQREGERSEAPERRLSTRARRARRART